MKKILVSLVAMMFLFAPMAFGLSIIAGDDPTVLSGEVTNGYLAPLQTNSNDQITTYLEINYGLVDYLYKSDRDDGTVSGPLANSYTSLYNDDASAATITYISGYIIDAPAYMVVKDGNNSPWWYLYNLTDLGWNGTDTLELSNFWPGSGAISHISIYGERAQVPEPSTLLLFGAGIAGLAMYRRKRS